MTVVPFPKFPRLALFDWDGTFCDSRSSIYDINLVMAKHYKRPLPSYEEWLQSAHPGVEACMRAIGVTDSRNNINAFFHRLLVDQRERGFQNPLYPGTEALLQYFQQHGVPMVLISRHLHEHLKMDVKAHGLSSYFDEIVGEPATGNLHKDLAMNWICAEFDVPNHSAFYLGNTSHDMRFAKQAGVCPVGVAHGYDPVSELEKEAPAHIFGSLLEFQEFLMS